MIGLVLVRKFKFIPSDEDIINHVCDFKISFKQINNLQTAACKVRLSASPPFIQNKNLSVILKQILVAKIAKGRQKIIPRHTGRMI